MNNAPHFAPSRAVRASPAEQSFYQFLFVGR